MTSNQKTNNICILLLFDQPYNIYLIGHWNKRYKPYILDTLFNEYLILVIFLHDWARHGGAKGVIGREGCCVAGVRHLRCVQLPCSWWWDHNTLPVIRCVGVGVSALLCKDFIVVFFQNPGVRVHADLERPWLNKVKVLDMFSAIGKCEEGIRYDLSEVVVHYLYYVVF